MTVEAACAATTHTREDDDGSADAAQPKQGRFKPGQSGNPKGRPRKVVRARSAIDRALDERVNITDSQGRKCIMSSAEVIAKRLVQKAMQGDMPALRELKAERPHLLTEVLKLGNGKDVGNECMNHLLSKMSTSAKYEFREAMSSWQLKKLELLGADTDVPTPNTNRPKY